MAVLVVISVKVAVAVEDESGGCCCWFGLLLLPPMPAPPVLVVVVILADDVVITPRKWDTGRGRDFGMDLLEQQSVINTTDDSMMNSVA